MISRLTAALSLALALAACGANVVYEPSGDGGGGGAGGDGSGAAPTTSSSPTTTTGTPGCADHADCAPSQLCQFGTGQCIGQCGEGGPLRACQLHEFRRLAGFARVLVHGLLH